MASPRRHKQHPLVVGALLALVVAFVAACSDSRRVTGPPGLDDQDPTENPSPDCIADPTSCDFAPGDSSGNPDDPDGSGDSDDDSGGDEPPVVTSTNPPTVVAGDQLAILGSDFGTVPSDVAVTIGGASASVLSVRDDRIVVQVPDGSTGVLDLQVQVRGNPSNPADVTVLPDVSGTGQSSGSIGFNTCSPSFASDLLAQLGDTMTITQDGEAVTVQTGSATASGTLSPDGSFSGDLTLLGLPSIAQFGFSPDGDATGAVTVNGPLGCQTRINITGQVD